MLINVKMVIFRGIVVMTETACYTYQSTPQMTAEWSRMVRNWLWLKTCFLYLKF